MVKTLEITQKELEMFSLRVMKEQWQGICFQNVSC